MKRIILLFLLLSFPAYAGGLIGGAANPNAAPTPTYSINFMSGSVGSFTFTRGSNQSCWNSSGVIAQVTGDNPCYEYDQFSLSPIGLLYEPTSTNLINDSQDLNGTYWGTVNSPTLTPNATQSPDGTVDATTLTASSSFKGVYNNPGFTAAGNVPYTESLFVKYVSGSQTAFQAGTTSINANIIFNPQTMTITSVASLVTSSGVQYEGNGWYRFQWTFTAPATVGCNFVLYPLTASQSITLALWGMDVEQQPMATSLIETTGTTATRNAESLVYSSPSFFNVSAGTLRFIYNPINNATYNQLASFDDTTLSNRVSLAIATGGSIREDIGSGGVLSVNKFAPFSAVTANAYNVAVMNYSNSAAIGALSQNGPVQVGNGVGTGTFVAPVGISELVLGNRDAADPAPFLGHIQGFDYWNTALTVSQMSAAGAP